MTSISTSTIESLSAVDLSRLPFPDFLVTKSYEDILTEMLADLNQRGIQRTGEPYIFHEADPAFIVLETCAYRIWKDTVDYQNQVKNMLVAYATGEWLDLLGANPPFLCQRLTIVPANDATIPPTEAVMETDDAYRKRLVITAEGYSCAGSRGAYLFHALSASGDIADVSVQNAGAGVVLVTVLSESNNGIASQDLLNTVNTALNADTVRPITDNVTVQIAQIISFSVDIKITTYHYTDTNSVLVDAKKQIESYINRHFKLGHDITKSGLIASATVEGVHSVTLNSPLNDVVCNLAQAPKCTSIAIAHAGVAL